MIWLAISFMKQNPNIRKEMAEAAEKQSEKFSEIKYYNNFIELIKKIEKGM